MNKSEIYMKNSADQGDSSSFAARQSGQNQTGLMAVIQKHVIVTGKVQGVFFRAYTKDTAEKYMIKGWVRNKRDGSVETVVQGKRKDMDQMIQWLHKGSPASSVAEVIIENQKDLSDFTDFKIRYI